MSILEFDIGGYFKSELLAWIWLIIFSFSVSFTLNLFIGLIFTNKLPRLF